MKLDQLIYFLEAAKHEHIGKAARILSISPSAISHSIAALEEEFGRDLFAKQGKRIFLTNHGKLLAERAEWLLREAERIRTEITSDSVELQGHYKMAATHVLADAILVPAWMKVQKVHSKTTAEIYSLRSAEVVSRVSDGQIEFGICLNPQEHPSFSMKKLHSGQLVITVRKGHPLLDSPARSQIARISSYPAALAKAFHGIDNCESHPMFGKHGIDARASFVYDSYAAAMSALMTSDHWSLLPDMLVARSKGRLIAIQPHAWAAPYTVAAIWPKSRIVTGIIEQLLQEIQKGLSV